ncbi:hypothetical protein K4H03_26600, partial [Mycobacterium tuberculosis]|nr:hypothetical protein [Mycobacterium tuberculosis]
MIALLLATALALQGQGRESLGVFDGWGAFRDAAPARCYAIAQPVQGKAGAFASIANWPRSGARGQVHI